MNLFEKIKLLFGGLGFMAVFSVIMIAILGLFFDGLEWTIKCLEKKKKHSNS